MSAGALLVIALSAAITPLVHASTQPLTTGRTVEHVHVSSCHRLHSDATCPCAHKLVLTTVTVTDRSASEPVVEPNGTVLRVPVGEPPVSGNAVRAPPTA